MSHNLNYDNLLQEKDSLDLKAKAGWRSFYVLREKYNNLGDYVRNLVVINSLLRTQLDDPEYNVSSHDITHLKNQFVDMYDRLKDFTECPVCFETITKNNIYIPKCGHLLCMSCMEKIKSDGKKFCPTCRKYL
jgi:hypothetical protein